MGADPEENDPVVAAHRRSFGQKREFESEALLGQLLFSAVESEFYQFRVRTPTIVPKFGKS